MSARKRLAAVERRQIDDARPRRPPLRRRPHAGPRREREQKDDPPRWDNGRHRIRTKGDQERTYLTRGARFTEGLSKAMPARPLPFVAFAKQRLLGLTSLILRT